MSSSVPTNYYHTQNRIRTKDKMNSKMSLYRTMIFVFLCDSDCPNTVITHTNRFFPILLFLVRSKEVSGFFFSIERRLQKFNLASSSDR